MFNVPFRVTENIEIFPGREFRRELEAAFSDEKFVSLFSNHSFTGMSVENLGALDFIAIISLEVEYTDSSNTNTQCYDLLPKTRRSLVASQVRPRCFRVVANHGKLVDRSGGQAVHSLPKHRRFELYPS